MSRHVTSNTKTGVIRGTFATKWRAILNATVRRPMEEAGELTSKSADWMREIGIVALMFGSWLVIILDGNDMMGAYLVVRHITIVNLFQRLLIFPSDAS